MGRINDPIISGYIGTIVGELNKRLVLRPSQTEVIIGIILAVTGSLTIFTIAFQVPIYRAILGNAQVWLGMFFSLFIGLFLWYVAVQMFTPN